MVLRHLQVLVTAQSEEYKSVFFCKPDFVPFVTFFLLLYTHADGRHKVHIFIPYALSVIIHPAVLGELLVNFMP